MSHLGANLSNHHPRLAQREHWAAQLYKPISARNLGMTFPTMWLIHCWLFAKEMRFLPALFRLKAKWLGVVCHPAL
jgi:hypothetical protein